MYLLEFMNEAADAAESGDRMKLDELRNQVHDLVQSDAERAAQLRFLGTMEYLMNELCYS